MAFYHPGARKDGMKGFDPKFKFGIAPINRSFDKANIPDLVKGELLALHTDGYVRKALSTDRSVELMFTTLLNNDDRDSSSSHSSGKIAVYTGDGIVETWLFDPSLTITPGIELTPTTVVIDGISRSVYGAAALGNMVCGLLDEAGSDGSIRVKHLSYSYIKA